MGNPGRYRCRRLAFARAPLAGHWMPHLGDLSTCTEEQLSVIEPFEIRERLVATDPDSNAEVIERHCRLKLKDSTRALDLLAKAAGLAGEWPATVRSSATIKRPPPKIRVVYEVRDTERLRELRAEGALPEGQTAELSEDVMAELIPKSNEPQ